MSVILKVDEKVQKILSILPENYSEDEFLTLFKKEYPKDYEKCMKHFWMKSATPSLGSIIQCNILAST